MCKSKLKPSALPSLVLVLIAVAAFVGGMILMVAGHQNQEFTIALLGAFSLGGGVFFCLMALLWWPRRGAA